MALDPLTELMADSNRMLAPEWACKPDHSQVPWIVIQFASYIYMTDAGLSKRQLRVNFLPLQCGPLYTHTEGDVNKDLTMPWLRHYCNSLVESVGIGRPELLVTGHWSTSFHTFCKRVRLTVTKNKIHSETVKNWSKGSSWESVCMGGVTCP